MLILRLNWEQCASCRSVLDKIKAPLLIKYRIIKPVITGAVPETQAQILHLHQAGDEYKLGVTSVAADVTLCLSHCAASECCAL